MEELIKVTEENGKQLVSAKELYENLGLDISHWNRWYKKNILDNPFSIENEDYVILALKAKNGKGRPSKDFALTIDFAKKLSMTAKTEAGEVCRNYFIRCEQIAKQYAQLDDVEKEGIKRINQVEGTKGVRQYLVDRYGKSKGVEYFIWWSKESHKEITGRTTKQTKKLGADLGLKSKQKASAKEIVRHIEPHNAFGLYVADLAVEGGAGSKLAINIGKTASKRLATKAPQIETDTSVRPF